MLLNLTDLSNEPLQDQLSRQIRAKILTGQLAAGEALPSIRALARDTRVSVITVQRGYETLERQGLIHSRRGKGFFVSQLDARAKKHMAENRLMECVEPIVTASLSEGLTPEEIVRAVATVTSDLASSRVRSRAGSEPPQGDMSERLSGPGSQREGEAHNSDEAPSDEKGA